ncbi:hypothetical protein CDAR_501161 [Caerostris darwini]|uniref:Uncharacterized protein n=1 Tax=Caerostris darwini TaxID=1538125 RepID=A0AAV4NNZ3_9ARAC|nr:hypothetical protein CDAR_501161 [Caerostris darwini]
MNFALLQPLVTGEKKERITKSLLTSKITFKDLAPTSKARPNGNWNSLSSLRYETKFDGTEYLKRFTIPFSIDVTPSKTSPMLQSSPPDRKMSIVNKEEGPWLRYSKKKEYKKKEEEGSSSNRALKFTIPFSIDVTPSKTLPMLQSSPPDRKMSIVNKEEGQWLRYSKKKRIYKKKYRRLIFESSFKGELTFMRGWF